MRVIGASGTIYHRIGSFVWMPQKRLLTFNEGGRHLTVTFRPWSWLRIYAFGMVLNIGGSKHG